MDVAKKSQGVIDRKEHIMPEDKGYSRGHKQSSTMVENPKAKKKTNAKRRGKRK